jgi:hypothetical protein
MTEYARFDFLLYDCLLQPLPLRGVFLITEKTGKKVYDITCI